MPDIAVSLLNGDERLSAPRSMPMSGEIVPAESGITISLQYPSPPDEATQVRLRFAL
jgi:hypothetical protein